MGRCPTTCSSKHSRGDSLTDPRAVDTTSSPHPTMDIITRSTEEEGRQAASPRSNRQQQHQCQALRIPLMLTELSSSSNSTSLLPHTPIPHPQRRSSAPLACLSRISSLVNNPVCRM